MKYFSLFYANAGCQQAWIDWAIDRLANFKLPNLLSLKAQMQSFISITAQRLPLMRLSRRLQPRSILSRSINSLRAPSGAPSVVLYAPTDDDMDLLASAIVSSCPPTPGDCYAMYGDVGAGKSTFVRCFIRSAMEDSNLHVPSPTFLLQNVYKMSNLPPVSILHMDLYRLNSIERDAQRLGLDSLDQNVTLIEWPERLEAVSLLPKERMDVLIEIMESYGSSPSTIDEDGRVRKVTLTPYGRRWEERLDTLMKKLNN